MESGVGSQNPVLATRSQSYRLDHPFVSDDGREYLAAVIEEIARRDRLRELVAQAGYVQDRGNPPSWVSRADVTRAVARLTGDVPGKGLGAELRQFLLAEGWRERRHGVHGDQWRARKVARVAAKPPQPR